MNLIINEDNLIALYAIGNGILHLTGYTLKMSHDEDLFTLPNEWVLLLFFSILKKC